MVNMKGNLKIIKELGRMVKCTGLARVNGKIKRVK
jgi:hypothetical protein